VAPGLNLEMRIDQRIGSAEMIGVPRLEWLATGVFYRVGGLALLVAVVAGAPTKCHFRAT
jgi:hypothetical protein